MCHIVGITPEATTLEMALGGKRLKQPLPLGRKTMTVPLKHYVTKVTETFRWLL